MSIIFISNELIVQFNDTSTHAPFAWLWDFGDNSTSAKYNDCVACNGQAYCDALCPASTSTPTPTPTPATCNSGRTATVGSYARFLGVLDYISIDDPSGTEIVSSLVILNKTVPACPSGDGVYTVHIDLLWTDCYTCSGTTATTTPTPEPTTTSNETSSPTPTPTPTEMIFTRPTTANPDNVPVADFSATPTTGTAPLTVQFTDESTHSPTAWGWTFGDGNTSRIQNPSHIYTSAGTYNVSLTVSKEQEGSNTTLRRDYVTVTAPQTTFYVYAEGSGFYPPGYDSLPEGNLTPRTFYDYLDGKSGAVNVDPSIHWTGRGLNVDNASDESHWNSSEQASSYADNADFSVFAGHGGNGHIIFGTSDRDVDLYSDHMKFGSNRAKWVTFFSCNTLNESTQTAWESVFDGVHIINGYDTEGRLTREQGTKYAEMLTGIGGGYTRTKIRDAWRYTLQETINDENISGAYMWADPCGGDYLPGFGDYCSAPTKNNQGHYVVTWWAFNCSTTSS